LLLSIQMNQEMAIKHLAQAEQMVALGLKHIADQELRMRCSRRGSGCGEPDGNHLFAAVR
jgi:hypothetical protein